MHALMRPIEYRLQAIHTRNSLSQNLIISNRSLKKEMKKEKNIHIRRRQIKSKLSYRWFEQPNILHSKYRGHFKSKIREFWFYSPMPYIYIYMKKWGVVQSFSTLWKIYMFKMNHNGSTILNENYYVICFSSELYFLHWNGIHISVILFLFENGKPIAVSLEWDLSSQ